MSKKEIRIIMDNGTVIQKNLYCVPTRKGAIKMEKVCRPNFAVIKNDGIPDDTEPRALPRMKTIKEMMELTGLSYTFLRKLCMQNEIVHIRTGKKYLINYDKFVDYLNGEGRA